MQCGNGELLVQCKKIYCKPLAVKIHYMGRQVKVYLHEIMSDTNPWTKAATMAHKSCNLRVRNLSHAPVYYP